MSETRTTPDCGTPKGHRRHYRRREKVCEPCRLAWNAYVAERRGSSTVDRGWAAAATRLRLPVDEYVARRAAGERWCSGCRDWHPASAFAGNRSYCTLSYQHEAARNRLLARLLVQ